LDGIVEKWVYFIKNADNLTMVPKSAESIPELNNAYTQASIISWTKDELDIYEYWRMEETSDRYKMQEEYEKGREKGREGGIEKGREKGRAEERLGNARKMKQKGYSLEDIIEITGLGRKEVESA
jgi:predicted transposase/invertase (TIGR01784 family)